MLWRYQNWGNLGLEGLGRPRGSKKTANWCGGRRRTTSKRLKYSFCGTKAGCLRWQEASFEIGRTSKT